MARTLENKLADAGYRMLGINEIEEMLISVLDSKNVRYLKAIPILIYLHNPNLEFIKQKTKQKKLFGEMIGITRKIFEQEGILQKLPLLDKKTNQDKKTNLNYEEFRQEFILQKKQREKPALLLEKEKIYAERSLQMWISILFTRKEKEIIKKMLDETQLSKTEYEYYSRKTKKKFNAIINLQELAKAMLPLSPKKAI